MTLASTNVIYHAGEMEKKYLHIYKRYYNIKPLIVKISNNEWK